LARYHPKGPWVASEEQESWLIGEVQRVGESPRNSDQIATHRSIKILTSQICFLLGLTHCEKYACTLNWTDNMPELDARPLQACPDCLRKLQRCLGFSIRDRYRKLVGHYQAAGFKREAHWVRRRLNALPKDLHQQTLTREPSQGS
jgi:hypothetical protein